VPAANSDDDEEPPTVINRLFRLLASWPRAVLMVAIAAGLLGVYAASRLELRTSFSELLPDDDPGVVTLKATQRRTGDLSLLLVGIRSPDRQANQQYAEALTRYLRTLPREISEIATYHVRDIHQFVENNRWLYASEEDLQEGRDRLRKEIGKRKNPLFLDLTSDDEEGTDDLRTRMKSKASFATRFPDGIFQNRDGDTVWVVALPPGGLLVENAGGALLAEARKFIRENPPSNFHPEMDAEPAGPLIAAIRNRAALQKDLVLVGSLCAILIPLSMGLFFRRFRAVIFIMAPALLATTLAYAVAWAVFGYLTTVTSFLVSFIMGNGTNYAIVLLSHYEERRRAGLPVAEATSDAVAAMWRSTGVAAIASALSYLSMLVTSFRGFSQFGLIGAAGCLLAWLTTFMVIPALLQLFDKRGPKVRKLRRESGLLGRLGGLVERHPNSILVAGGVITVAMAAGLSRFRKDAFEYDFRKLSATIKVDQRADSFDKDKDELFGRWPHPTVLLADRTEDIEPLRAAIRRADQTLPGNDVIGQMLSVHDILPGTPELQKRKLSLLADIRKNIDDPALELLDADRRKELMDLRPPDHLRLLQPRDLPPLARRPFTEADGTLGRVLLLYPPEQGLSIWDGNALLRIASVLQRVPLPDGREVETSGTAVIFAAMIRSILHDGPIATAASLICVILLVLLRVRPLRSAVLVIASLLAGVIWMVGIAGWLGLKITFLNFIALPFIFGVGVEYAIHVVTEYQEQGSVRRTIVSAGGPVALCSWSAIVGYGSLLVASNGALRGLGSLATLGEITCLLTAVILTPAALHWASLRSGSPAARAAGERASSHGGP
jgi:uncharacterized protein